MKLTKIFCNDLEPITTRPTLCVTWEFWYKSAYKISERKQLNLVLYMLIRFCHDIFNERISLFELLIRKLYIHIMIIASGEYLID